MAKWPGGTTYSLLLLILYKSVQITLFSMNTMNKPLKHPQRLHFLNGVDNISKTLLQESVSTEKTVSVNVTRDHFTFSRCWQKVQWEDCGCSHALKLQVNRRKIPV